MPRGPKGEKRPADVIGNAIHVMRIATGEIEEDKDSRDGAAITRGSLGGKKGGKARAKTLTAEQRREIAHKGAAKRWNKS